MVLTLEDMGFEIEASHHEMAPAQHEIDFRYDEALTTADNIMTFKLAVKTIAKRHGLHASFMPKPKTGINGSGMHINMSLSKDGKNIFADDCDPNGLSQEAYYFIGGLMRHVKGMCAITNPLVNSYKRLVPDLSTGLHCLVRHKPQPADPHSGRTWGGHENRTALSGSVGKSIPGAGSLPGSRTGRHPEADHASGSC